MPTRLTGGVLSVLALAALLTSLVLSGQSQAQQKQKSNPVQDEKKFERDLKKAAREEVKGKEAENLKVAYIYMAMANHDYDGHRGRAMNQIEAAIKSLDASILKRGTGNQKVVALQEEIAVARAKFLASQQGPIHEGQA